LSVVLGAITLGGSAPADPRPGMPKPSAPPPAPPPPIQMHHPIASPARNAQDPVNVLHLQSLRARAPQKCGPREVAPNVWVKIDCHPYPTIQNAKPLVFTVGRAKMLRTGKLRLDSTLGAGAGATSDGLPANVDHRKDGTEGPIKNQEYTSMCTGFSLSSTMDNAILRLGASDVTSPTHLWAHYGEPSMALAASGNLNKSIATWPSWPFSPKEGCELSRFDDDCGDHYGVRTNSGTSDPKIRSELSAADEGGKYTIASIEKMGIPADPGDVAAVLATGADLWVAFSLDATKWGFRELMNNDNVIPDWSDPEGGHAVMLAGYRTTPSGGRQFLVHNSWGSEWGDGGYAWISDTMVHKYMHAAYKIKVTPTAAPPAQPLTDDDCDSDELVDSGTGQCAPECDDGSRPNNGQCPGGGGGAVSSKARSAATPAPAPANGQCPAGTEAVRGHCVRTFHFGK
jgi:hypothetical protein